MKTIITLLILILSLNSYAQKVVIDATGNYKAVSSTSDTSTAKPTGKTFTDSKGNIYPVYLSKNGKLFVLRTSVKTGNQYRQYLKL